MSETVFDCPRQPEAVIASLQNERLPHGWESRLLERSFELNIKDERGRLEISGSLAPHLAGSRIVFRSRRILGAFDYVFTIIWLIGLAAIFAPMLKPGELTAGRLFILLFFLAVPWAVNKGNQRVVLREFKKICCGGESPARSGENAPAYAGTNAGEGMQAGIVLDSPHDPGQVVARLKASASRSWPFTFEGPAFFMLLPTGKVMGRVEAGRMGSRVPLVFFLSRGNRLLLSLWSVFVIAMIAVLFFVPDLIEGGPAAFNLAAAAIMLLGPWGNLLWQRRRTIRKIRKIIG